MPITVYDKPVDAHTRYVVTFDDQPPTVTTIHGLTAIVRERENLKAVWLLQPDQITPVRIDHDDTYDNFWVYVPDDNDGPEIEALTYQGTRTASHQVFVDGFDNDTVPLFQ